MYKQCQKLFVWFLQNTPFALLAIHSNMYCVHKLIKHSIPILCFFTISNIELMSWWSMAHKTYSMVYNFVEICAELPVCNDIPCDSSDYSVSDIFWFFLFMVHGGGVTFISVGILKIPMTAYDMHHRWVSSKKNQHITLNTCIAKDLVVMLCLSVRSKHE